MHSTYKWNCTKVSFSFHFCQGYDKPRPCDPHEMHKLLDEGNSLIYLMVLVAKIGPGIHIGMLLVTMTTLVHFVIVKYKSSCSLNKNIKIFNLEFVLFKDNMTSIITNSLHNTDTIDKGVSNNDMWSNKRQLNPIQFVMINA